MLNKTLPVSRKRCVLPSVLLVSVLLGLFACSSEKVNPPTPLEKFWNKVRIERLWKVSVGSGDEQQRLQLSPVIVGDTIYVLDPDGRLYALDRLTGKRLWQKVLKQQVSGALGADTARLYYATFQGELVCLERDSGNELWRQSLTSEAISVPTSDGTSVVVQTIDGKVFSFAAKDGVKRWRYDSIDPILSLRGTPSPLISANYTLTSFAGGELLAFDNDTGKPYWKAMIGVPQGRTELERLVDPDGQPIIDSERVYAVAYQGKLVALDVRSGQELWAKPMSSFNGVASAHAQVYVATAEGEVIAVKDNSGAEVWRNEKLKYRRLSTPVTIANMVVVADFEGYLHFLSQTDGTFLARKRPDSDGVTGQMLVVDDVLYAYARSGDLVAYRIVSK